MKKGFVLIVFLCLNIMAIAQIYTPKPKMAHEFYRRSKLIVVAGAGETGEIFTEGIKANWIFPQEMSFMTYNEGAQLMAKYPGEYSMIVYAYRDKLKFSDMVVHGEFYGVKGIIDFEDGELKYVFEGLFPNPPNPIQMAIAVRMFSSYLPSIVDNGKPYDVVADVEKLKSKTLLLAEGQLAKNLSLEEAMKIYGAKIEIVSPKFLTEVIEQKKPGYSFIYNMQSAKKGFFNFIAVDAATFDVLSVVSIGGMGFGEPLRMRDMPEQYKWMYNGYELEKKHLKYFLGKGAQKINR